MRVSAFSLLQCGCNDVGPQQAALLGCSQLMRAGFTFHQSLNFRLFALITDSVR